MRSGTGREEGELTRIPIIFFCPVLFYWLIGWLSHWLMGWPPDRLMLHSRASISFIIHIDHIDHIQKKIPPFSQEGIFCLWSQLRLVGFHGFWILFGFFSKDWIYLLTDGSGFGFSKKWIFGFSWSGQNSLGLFHWIGFCFLGTDVKRAFNRLLFSKLYIQFRCYRICNEFRKLRLTGFGLVRSIGIG
jgi:hypothetical protein